MFTAFSQSTGDFLWGLSMNNDRTWFNEHRDEYESHVNQPFRGLAFETLSLLKAHYPQLDLQLHISRIWRDARRLFGRGPFKDHLWFSIQSGSQRTQGPMFWFELGPTSWSYGAGNWEDSADVAAAWRARIDADPERFKAIVQDLMALGADTLWGKAYKRPKADRGELLNPWYNRRHISVGREMPYGGPMYATDFPEYLAARFAELMPFYRFLCDVWNKALTDRAGR